jgi:hypothetical protein
MWLRRFVLRRLAMMVLLTEARMGVQDDCKHESQAGTYCGLCGKQLGADPEVAGALRRELTKMLKDEYGLDPKPPKKVDGTPAESSTLADKIFGAKKKKEK